MAFGIQKIGQDLLRMKNIYHKTVNIQFDK